VSPEVADRRATSYEETRDAPARLLTTRYSPLRIVLAVALLLLGAGAWALGEYFSKPPEAEALGSNLPVNIGASDPRDISAHNSPTLVANPVDPSNLAISNRVDSPRFSCALHLSFDGAASWGQTPIPVPRGEQPKCYAPDVAFGRDGTMYLSFVTLKGRGNVPNAVWLTTSSDGGRTLSAPSKILGPLAFQVRLTADPTIDDRLYLTWLQASGVSLYRFAETGNPINLARSDDGGETWQGPEQVSDPARERVVAPVFSIGPDSALSLSCWRARLTQAPRGTRRSCRTRSSRASASSRFSPRSHRWPSTTRAVRCTSPITMPGWGTPTCGCGNRATEESLSRRRCG
jgi:hypothetical protein